MSYTGIPRAAIPRRTIPRAAIPVNESAGSSGTALSKYIRRVASYLYRGVTFRGPSYRRV